MVGGGGGGEGGEVWRGEPVLRIPTARQLGHPWHFKKGGNEEGGGVVVVKGVTYHTVVKHRE